MYLNRAHFISFHTELKYEEVCTLDRAGKLSARLRYEVEKKKVKRLSSNVWKSFLLVFDATNNRKIANWVKCSKCSDFCRYNGVTTSKLLKHKCLKNGQPTIGNFFASTSTRLVKLSKTEVTQVRDAASEFIVKDIRPYYALEGSGLQKLCKTMIDVGRKHPNITEADIERIIPSRWIMRRHIDTKASNIKEQLKNYFKQAIDTVGGFSCTLDLYTDRYKCITYMGITAKLNIFDGENVIQKEITVHLVQIKSIRKTGAIIRIEINKVFEEFEISDQQIRENITWITDRGGNIRVALEDCERLNCFAHLINNIVETMCKETIKDFVTAGASLVRYLKKSGLCNELAESLRSYCETRWNTVYFLFLSILNNYNQIYSILLQREQLTSSVDLTSKLTCIPKSDLKHIVDFLELFAMITIIIQGEKYETLHTVWPYYSNIEKHLLSNVADSTFVKKMKAKGREYIGSNFTDFSPKMIHKVAVFLHPILKHLNCATDEEKSEIIDHVKSKISEIPVESERSVLVQEAVGNNSLQSRSRSKSSSLFGDFIDNQIPDGQSIPNLNEVDAYINLHVDPVK